MTVAKHTQHFTQDIRGYLSTGRGERAHRRWAAATTALPDALRLSLLRGEMIVRERFLAYCESKHLDDAFAWAAHEKLYRGYPMVEFVQQTGLLSLSASYVTAGTASMTADHQAQCYQLYCLLVDHLAQHEESALLTLATTGMIQHYLPSFFPKIGTAKPSLAMLQSQLRKLLNRQWHTQVKVKESFTTDDHGATMQLIAHVQGCYPLSLVCVEAKRLRSARFQAYHQLLDALTSGAFTDEPQPKPVKKHQPMQPL